MARTLEEVRADAMELDEDDRLVLGEALLATVSPEPGYEEAWTAEIERRIAEVEAGTATLIPAEEAIANARAALHDAPRASRRR